jgi:hypothetical protein
MPVAESVANVLFLGYFITSLDQIAVSHSSTIISYNFTILNCWAILLSFEVTLTI